MSLLALQGLIINFFPLFLHLYAQGNPPPVLPAAAALLPVLPEVTTLRCTEAALGPPAAVRHEGAARPVTTLQEGRLQPVG